MATQVNVEQSSKEELIYPIEWEQALLDGVTISSLSFEHIPPSGGVVVPGQQIILPSLSYVKMPAGLVIGTHTLSVVVTTSNEDLSPEVFMVIVVDR